MIARRLSIHGRVQGVGFRYALAQQARAAAITGWVRNRADGTVEAFLQGPEDAVGAVEAWAAKGPPSARVDRVVADAAAVEACDGFEQRASA